MQPRAIVDDRIVARDAGDSFGRFPSENRSRDLDSANPANQNTMIMQFRYAARDRRSRVSSFFTSPRADLPRRSYASTKIYRIFPTNARKIRDARTSTSRIRCCTCTYVYRKTRIKATAFSAKNDPRLRCIWHLSSDTSDLSRSIKVILERSDEVARGAFPRGAARSRAVPVAASF